MEPPEPPPIPETPKDRKLKKELTTFPFFLGTLLAGLSIWALATPNANAAPWFGYPFRYVLSAILLPISLIFFIAGIGFTLTHKKSFSVLGAIASTLFSLTYGFFMMTRTGAVPISLLTLVAIIIPILHWQRTHQFQG